MALAFIVIDGKRYGWRDILKLLRVPGDRCGVNSERLHDKHVGFV
jgi:hypothetical protein